MFVFASYFALVSCISLSIPSPVTTGSNQFASWSQALSTQVGSSDVKTQATNFAQIFAGGKQCFASADLSAWFADSTQPAPCIDDAINVAGGAQVVGISQQQIQNGINQLHNATAILSSQLGACGDLQSRAQQFLGTLPDPNAQAQLAQSCADNLTAVFQQLCGSAYGNPNGVLPMSVPSNLSQLTTFLSSLSSLTHGNGGNTGSGTGGSSSSGVPPNLMGILGSLLNGTTSSSGGFNVTGLLSMFPGLHNLTLPHQKRQESTTTTSASTSTGVVLGSLINEAQHLFTNAPVNLQQHCASLNAMASASGGNNNTPQMRKRQASGGASASTPVGQCGLALGAILAHCQNIQWPSSVPSSVQANVTAACQRAAALASNASSTAILAQFLHNNLNVSQFAQQAAQQLHSAVSSILNTVASCQQAISSDPNNAALQSQFQSTVPNCQQIGASVQATLPAYTPGAMNSGASISAQLQSQIASCKQQLETLRSQFNTEAQSDCPGITQTVQCIKRHPVLFNFTVAAAINCTESFVDALNNGAAIFNATVTQWCANPDNAQLCAQFQQVLNAAELHLSGLTDNNTDPSDPNALCRRDASFFVKFADPANMSGGNGQQKRDVSATFGVTLASLGSSCPAPLTSCSTTSSTPDPSVAASSSASASVPPIPGIDDVTVSSTTAPVVVTAAPLRGSAATMTVAAGAALVGLAALI